jgi:hypothetical protein
MEQNNDSQIELFDGDFKSEGIMKYKFRAFIPEEDSSKNINKIKKIEILTKESSIKFWNMYFSSKNTSMMKLDRDDWVCKVKWTDVGDWGDAYNSNQPDNVSNLLKNYLKWEKDTVVYYCCGCRNIIKSNWENFLDMWMNFLEYEDEAPIIVGSNKNEVIRFTPIGRIQASKRYS